MRSCISSNVARSLLQDALDGKHPYRLAQRWPADPEPLAQTRFEQVLARW
jgi:hypothetical protein